MVTLVLPYPPSVNGYWRTFQNRQILSRRGREYRELVAGIVVEQALPRFLGRLAVSMELFPPDRRQRDVDNAPKAVLDALEHAGVYLDDSQVKLLVVRMRDHVGCDPAPEKPGRVAIRIEEEPR